MTNEERANELALTASVGQALKALGLRTHVELARAYYRRIQRGLPSPEPDAWGHEMIVEWARLLRLPPHEHDSPVRPRGAGSKCGCATPQTYTAGVFPGGSKHVCGACKFTFVPVLCTGT